METFVPDDNLVLKINDLMKKGFEIPNEKLTKNAKLVDDLGLDSLDAVDMLVFIEDEFGIKVDGEKMKSLRTMQDVYFLASDAIKKSTNKVI
jgi:acyl carrier protein